MHKENCQRNFKKEFVVAIIASLNGSSIVLWDFNMNTVLCTILLKTKSKQKRSKKMKENEGCGGTTFVRELMIPKQ